MSKIYPLFALRDMEWWRMDEKSSIEADYEIINMKRDNNKKSLYPVRSYAYQPEKAWRKIMLHFQSAVKQKIM